MNHVRLTGGLEVDPQPVLVPKKRKKIEKNGHENGSGDGSSDNRGGSGEGGQPVPAPPTCPWLKKKGWCNGNGSGGPIAAAATIATASLPLLPLPCCYRHRPIGAPATTTGLCHRHCRCRPPIASNATPRCCRRCPTTAAVPPFYFSMMSKLQINIKK